MSQSLSQVLFGSRMRLVLFFLLAFIVSKIPFFNLPFTWTQTFFHEISHGLAALFTGGQISRIELRINGSGVCYTRGGSNFLVSFAGYAGAALWGSLLFYISTTTAKKHIKIIATCIIMLIVVCLLLWARDLLSIVILVSIAAVIGLIYKLGNSQSLNLFIQFLGCYVMLDALQSPLYLLDGRSIGDGANLANITHLPEFVWIIVWEIFSILCIIYLWKTISRRPSHQ